MKKETERDDVWVMASQKRILRAARYLAKSRWDMKLEKFLQATSVNQHLRFAMNKIRQLNNVLSWATTRREEISKPLFVKSFLDAVSSLHGSVSSMKCEADNCGEALRDRIQASASLRLGVPQFYRELKMLADRYGGGNVRLEFHTRPMLIITIEDVTLRDKDSGTDVELNDFEVRLDLQELMKIRQSSLSHESHVLSNYLMVKALDPHWNYDNNTSNHYFHPHVDPDDADNLGHVCFGSEDQSVSLAAEQLRLFDLVSITEAILRTYNPEGPYLEIGYWVSEDYGNDQDRECEECGGQFHEDDVYDRDCGHDTCSDCYNPCNDRRCEDQVCHSCSVVCAECNLSFCDRHASSVACGHTVCNECRVVCACDTVTCSTCSIECDTCGNTICETCANLCGESSDCTAKLCSKCYTEGNCSCVPADVPDEIENPSTSGPEPDIFAEISAEQEEEKQDEDPYGLMPSLTRPGGPLETPDELVMKVTMSEATQEVLNTQGDLAHVEP